MSNYSFKTVRWTITNLSGYICLGFVSSVDNKLISWSGEGFYLFPPPKKNIEKRKLWLSCLESWGSFTTLKLLRMNVSKEMITVKSGYHISAYESSCLIKLSRAALHRFPFV